MVDGSKLSIRAPLGENCIEQFDSAAQVVWCANGLKLVCLNAGILGLVKGTTTTP
jgi:hypothetical protein